MRPGDKIGRGEKGGGRGKINKSDCSASGAKIPSRKDQTGSKELIYPMTNQNVTKAVIPQKASIAEKGKRGVHQSELTKTYRGVLPRPHTWLRRRATPRTLQPGR